MADDMDVQNRIDNNNREQSVMHSKQVCDVHFKYNCPICRKKGVE